MKEKNKFFVLYWNINTNSLDKLDVLSYLEEWIKKRPKTKSELEIRINRESINHFWCKCEWEMIISNWPKQDRTKKIDVHHQITLNLEVITELLWQNLK